MDNNTCLPPNLIYKLLLHFAVDADKLFLQHNIDLQALNAGEQRIDCQKIRAIWDEAEQLIDEPGFALQAGEFWHPSFMNALGYAWLASSSLYTALSRLQRFSKIISHSFRIELIENEQELVVRFGDEMFNQKRPIVEALISILLAMCRANYGHQLIPHRVMFAFETPDCVEQYQQYFQSSLSFNQNCHAIVFSMDVVKQPLAGGNPNFIAFYEQELVKYLSKMDNANLVDHLKRLIVEQLPSGRVTLAGIAGDMAMSSRQLQRKLNHHQVNFKEILDEIRLNLSYQYLKNPSLSLIEIAFLLGFSEVSSFSRAFKRAKGVSPSDYRQQPS